MTQTPPSIRQLAEALQKQLNASVGCLDVKCEGCQREITLIESALLTLATQIRKEDALTCITFGAQEAAAAIRARQENCGGEKGQP